MKKLALLLIMALPASVMAATGVATHHALLTCMPDQRQDGVVSEEFNKLFPELINQAIAKVKSGTVTEAYFLDENYRNGAAFLVKGKTGTEARANAEQFKQETEKLLTKFKLPFKGRCMVGGKMVLPK
ncbi:hypothetical protein [Vogesella mureinivorans]|uniref:hypothetical protein n=1 Tax=Vogesella mureinivorans TaxID=657276 RepID=UPI0011C94387|nr:hypothetical protein [Vogesella mureinivorans]